MFDEYGEVQCKFSEDLKTVFFGKEVSLRVYATGLARLTAYQKETYWNPEDYEYDIVNVYDVDFSIESGIDDFYELTEEQQKEIEDYVYEFVEEADSRYWHW